MKTGRTLAPLLAIGLLLAPLAGCSVAVVDGTAKPESSHDRGTDGETDADADAELTEDEPSGDDDTADTGLDRETLIGAATSVRRCDGELTILDDAVAVYVEGTCERLILNSTGSQIATDDVAYLEVIGDGNVVLSGAVEKLLVNGMGNIVHWTGATPTVTDVGSSNVLTAG